MTITLVELVVSTCQSVMSNCEAVKLVGRSKNNNVVYKQ